MSANDMDAAQKTYEGFIKGLTVSVPALLLLTAFVIVAIAS